MNVREVITESLHELGVDTVFALGSTGILDLLGTLEQSENVNVVHTRHEEGAIAMADAYARSGGDIGVAMVGMGPAVAHTGTGLVTARKFGSNMLLIVPAPSMTFETYFPKKRFDGFYEKSFNQDQYLASTIENVVSVRGPDAIIPNLRETIRQLRNGDGPVALQVPMDVFEREVPNDVDVASLVETGGYSGPETRTVPDESQITEAVELFLDSDVTKVPVVLAGAGAVESGAKEAIAELAEQMNAVIATTLRGRGHFDDHPYSVGLIGSYGSTVANKYATETDYLLAVGCSLNVRTTDSGHLINEDAKIVQIDVDESAIERYEPVDIGIKGDATKTVEALTDTLVGENIDRAGTFWDDDLREEIDQSTPWEETEFPDTPGTVDPRELIRWFDDALPSDRFLVVDTGHHAKWAVGGIDTDNSSDLLFPGEFASIGLGIYMGLGASLQATEKNVVAFCGDSAFMMAIHDLDTAVKQNAPITYIVVNDNALGAEYHTLKNSGRYAEMSIQETPDFGEIARSFGAEGYTIGSIEELEEIRDVITQSRDGPLVVNCLVNRNVSV